MFLPLSRTSLERVCVMAKRRKKGQRRVSAVPHSSVGQTPSPRLPATSFNLTPSDPAVSDFASEHGFAGRIAALLPPSIPALLSGFVLCALVAAAFFPAMRGGFVWDDSVWMDPGPVQSPSGLWHIWLRPSMLQNEAHYWPIPYTVLWLEYQLWEFAPLGYHMVNLLLHAGVVLLLWRVLLRLGAPGAWIVAAVFAVHPLHVESVAWVIGRKDMLAAVFSLASVLLYLRFMENRRWQLFAGALALFVLSLLSKSIAVTLPVALLIVHWWRHGSIAGADLKRVTPFVLVALVITAFDLWLYQNRDPTDFGYSPIERVLIAARVLAFYTSKLLWPTDLAVIYPRWEVRSADPLGWGYFVAALVVTALLWFYRDRTGRGPLAGALFFVVTLSPILGLVEYGYMKFSFVAERYQYLAGAGLIALLVGTAVWVYERLAPGRTGTANVISVLLLASLLTTLGVLTWHQSHIYRDELAFYSHVAALNPKARFANLMLGREYQKQGLLDEALAFYRAEQRNALEQDSPDSYVLSNVHLGLGAIAEARGQFDEAEAHYRSGITFPETFQRLVRLLRRQGRYDEVLALHENLLANNPEGALLHLGMGEALLALDRVDEALQRFEQALRLDPYLEEASVQRDRLLQSLEEKGK